MGRGVWIFAGETKGDKPFMESCLPCMGSILSASGWVPIENISVHSIFGLLPKKRVYFFFVLYLEKFQERISDKSCSWNDNCMQNFVLVYRYSFWVEIYQTIRVNGLFIFINLQLKSRYFKLLLERCLHQVCNISENVKL